MNRRAGLLEKKKKQCGVLCLQGIAKPGLNVVNGEGWRISVSFPMLTAVTASHVGRVSPLTARNLLVTVFSCLQAPFFCILELTVMTPLAFQC